MLYKDNGKENRNWGTAVDGGNLALSDTPCTTRMAIACGC